MLYTTLVMAAVANAHLFIRSPPPIAGSAIKDPLTGDGSNFPCHGITFPGSGGMAMQVGSTQHLVFEDGGGANTATHGGGSCQISVTYETDPQKIRDPTNWKVIESIEGGCPTNSMGNLDAGYTGPDGAYSGAVQCNDTETDGVNCLNQFTFALPKGLEDGQATLAWTWFNTIGNREMYMNCVAIDVQGGDGSQMEKLPAMFVANLGAGLGGCATTERTVVGFPEPGPVLEIHSPSPRVAGLSTTWYPISTPDCGSSNGGSYPGPTTTATAGGAALTGAPSAPAGGPSAYLSQSATVYNNAEGAAAVYPNKGVTDPESSSGSCAAGSVSCSTPGALVCPDSQHFGLCDINNCAVVGAVSAGTQCKDGAITFADAQKRDALRKRLVRFARHAHHRRS